MDNLSYYLSYTRLAIIFGSWFLVTDHPEIFLSLMAFQHLLYISQQYALTMPKEEAQTADANLTAPAEEEEQEEKELDKQLRILITRLATSIMIFAVIR